MLQTFIYFQISFCVSFGDFMLFARERKGGRQGMKKKRFDAVLSWFKILLALSSFSL